MLENYFPILVFLMISTGIGVFMLALGFLFGKGTNEAAKLSPY